MRLALAVILLWSMAWTPRAHADDASKLDKAKRIGEKVVIGKKRRGKGKMFAVGIGWEVLDSVSACGQLGYAWGTQRAGLANAASMHHVSLAVRLSTPPDPIEAAVDLGLMVGHSWRALAHFGIEAGPTVLVTPNVAAGGLARLRVGFRGFGLQAYAGARVGEQTDIIGGIGVELFSLPKLSGKDIAKSVVPDVLKEL